MSMVQTIHQLIQQLPPADKLALHDLLSKDAPPDSVHTGQLKTMEQLNATRAWSKQDYQQAAQYVSLPAGLTNFLTIKKVI